MEQGDNAALVRYDGEVDEEYSLDENTPITLDVIAREQSEDSKLAHMIERAPSVFSTANNGSVQLITARGKDKKYRIVIPTSLQAKVLKTYHDCLVNPSQENNFAKVLYVHFTWNGIHKDVENYILNDGLTDEMRMRRGCRINISGRGDMLRSRSSVENHLTINRSSDRCFRVEEAEEHGVPSSKKLICLDEIAKEQKKDKELRQLKKEEPFVFSTVRYGDTLLTTAQNFRDNKYRIVIPRRLQGRMLKTYRECLLNPTPDRNFDTLLYNHFTWNGIHDDVDYFVKNGGNLPEKVNDSEDIDECRVLIPLVEKLQGKRDDAAVSQQDVGYFEWIRRNEKFENKVKNMRIAFLVSGFLVIISSVMFFEQGVHRVINSLNDAQGVFQVSLTCLGVDF
jgi:DNA-binding transcriptional regulator/RsmH inhibitor MraZ